MSPQGPDEMEPLDPELDRFLSAERQRPEERGDGARGDRVLAAVLATVGPGPGGGGDGGGGATPAEPGATGAAAAASSVGSFATLPVVLASVSFLAIGAVAGAAIHASLAEPEVITRELIREVEVPIVLPRVPTLPPRAETPDDGTEAVAAIEVEPAASEEARAREAPAPRATRRPTEPGAARSPEAAAPATGPDTLARESALLARAQAALGRGAPALALTALREHEERHPDGQLREEREALWISALVASGDRPAAERRARTFRARYPSSPLGPTIDATLREGDGG